MNKHTLDYSTVITFETLPGKRIELYSNKFPSWFGMDSTRHAYNTNIERLRRRDSASQIVYIIESIGDPFVCSTASTFVNPIDETTARPILHPSRNIKTRRSKAEMRGNLELAYSTCCAYSALVMSYVFYQALRECRIKKKLNEFLKCVKKVLLKFKTNNYSTADESHATLVELEFLHMGINGYNNKGENVYDNTSLISRARRCPTEEAIPTQFGVYLVSIVSDIMNGGCNTYHHFMIFILGDRCIIYDSWLGGGGQGNRCSWTRDVLLADFIYIFNTMNSPQTTVDIKEEILLKFFAAPYLRGANAYKRDYKFRYYSKSHFQSLIDLNRAMVREAIVTQSYDQKYNKDIQKGLQGIFFTPEKFTRVSKIQEEDMDMSQWVPFHKLQHMKRKTRQMQEKPIGSNMTIGRIRKLERLRRRSEREREREAHMRMQGMPRMRRMQGEDEGETIFLGQRQQEGQKFATVEEMRRAEARMQTSSSDEDEGETIFLGYGMRKNKKNKSKRKRRNINNK